MEPFLAGCFSFFAPKLKELKHVDVGASDYIRRGGAGFEDLAFVFERVLKHQLAHGLCMPLLLAHKLAVADFTLRRVVTRNMRKHCSPILFTYINPFEDMFSGS